MAVACQSGNIATLKRTCRYQWVRAAIADDVVGINVKDGLKTKGYMLSKHKENRIPRHNQEHGSQSYTGGSRYMSDHGLVLLEASLLTGVPEIRH